LIFALPIWIALVAAGSARVTALVPVSARTAIPLAVILVAVFAPSAVADPRTIPTGEKTALAAPAAWLRVQVSPNDMLYPLSPVFLAALTDARAYPREPVALARAIERTGVVESVFVSIPLEDPLLRARTDQGRAFRRWLILRQRGPFGSGKQALEATAEMLRRVRPTLTGDARAYLDQLRGTACAVVRC